MAALSGSAFASLITPYTTFAVEVAAVLVAGWLASSLGFRLAPAVAGVAVVVLGALLVPALWGAAGSFDSVRAGLATAPGIRQQEKCFADNGTAGFIPVSRRLESLIPPGASIGLDGREIQAVCLQLALLPRRFVPESEKPSYVIVARDLTAAERARARREQALPEGQRKVTMLGDKLLLVRRS
jgi:hypothetical protein